MSNKTLVRSIAFGTLALASAGTVAFINVSAQTSQNTSSAVTATTVQTQGYKNRGMFSKGPGMMVTDTTDFNTWKTQVQNTPFGTEILAKINESNFGRFKEMYKLKQSGDKAGAQKIAQELGIDGIKMGGPRGDRGHGPMMSQATIDAMKNSDYNAWKASLPKDQRSQDLLTKIDTEDKFKQLVQAYNLHQQADQIEINLGIKPAKPSTNTTTKTTNQ